MQKHLVRPSEYARIVGVNPSTISRQIARGRIPTVDGVNGERLVDVAQANEARRHNHSIISGHGGKPDRAIRQSVAFKAKHSTGYDPAQRAMLCVMRGSWPDLVRRAMGVLGADEMDAARAVVAVQELIETLACVVHDDLNAGGHWNYQEPLSDWPAIEWTDADVEAWFSRYAFGHWCSDDKDEDGFDPLDGGFEINSEMMECAYAAVPKK